MQPFIKLASLNARDRRALLLGAFVITPGLFVPLVVKPYLHALSAMQEQTAYERDRLTRERPHHHSRAHHTHSSR